MKTVAYLKTSLDRREIQEQKQAILEFTQREGITVSRFIEMPASATRGKRKVSGWMKRETHRLKL